MNLLSTIIPKSDQLNSDDLIGGPRTVKITSVKICAGQQPVAISFEGDENRPYKPSKGMRRVMVAMWGGEGGVYVGRRLTLFRNPEVPYGGQNVGGIEISHASHIAAPFEIAISVSRGKRKLVRVEPLVAESVPLDLAALMEMGEVKAKAGTKVLREWWLSLPAAARASLKPTLDGEWKQLAEAADMQPKEAT